jgi:folate-binding protein YgfZ
MSSSVLLVDRSSRGRIALKGSDRARFLHGLLTNEIASLTPGTGTYAAYLTPQGRMISDMRVVETGNAILLDAESSVVVALARKLDSLVFSEDVTIENVTAALTAIGLHGASAPALLDQLGATSAKTLERQFDNVRASIAGCETLIIRDDYLGLTGFDVYAAAEVAPQVTTAILERGAVLADEPTAEALRVEAGRPRFGVDMDTETIPLEAGLQDRAISFTKGCYVGQEVIVRVMHRGQGRVARRLVRLALRGSSMPARGDAILAEGARVGEITSAARSPKTGAPIAMGYVHRDHAFPGAALTVGGLQALVEQLVN